MSCILTKRVYEPAAKADGFRILVDRLWPRGIKKAQLAADAWMKDIAPSAALRKWFDHDPAKWAGFRKQYKTEIEQSEALPVLLDYCKNHPTITLLYSARDEKHNQALVLQELLNSLQKK